jgi:hypothetical protein
LDSGASTKIMPFSIFQALGVNPIASKNNVTYLDRTKLIIGELGRIPMQLAYDPKVQKVIDIQVEKILDRYGLIMGRDFMCTLNGHISIGYSHM